MRLFFTEDQKKTSLNVFEIDDVIFTAEYIEGGENGALFIISGSAVIDDEKYNDMKIKVELEGKYENPTLENIMRDDWVSYDFVFEV